MELRFTVATGDSTWEIDVADVQVTNGTYAATFINPTVVESELRCFPFYQKTFSRGVAVVQNSGVYVGAVQCRAFSTVGNYIRVQWFFPVKMRTSAPTITTYCYNAASSNFSVGGVTTVTASSNSTTEAQTVIDGGGGITVAVGDAIVIHVSADAQL